jgi:hypothetical protein
MAAKKKKVVKKKSVLRGGRSGPKYPVKKNMQSMGNWFKSGMPLPGAVKPPKGKTYLRGKLVPSGR